MQRQKITEELRIQTAALQAAAHGVMITDRSGNIVFVNPAFVSLTGYAADEALEQSPSFLNSGRHDAALYAGLWNRALAGEVWHGRDRQSPQRRHSLQKSRRSRRSKTGTDRSRISWPSWRTAPSASCIENQLARQNQQLRSIKRKGATPAAICRGAGVGGPGAQFQSGARQSLGPYFGPGPCPLCRAARSWSCN